MCNPPPSLRNAHRQADIIAPSRHWDPETDGICGDPAHASRSSDHNPDSRGIPHAVDVDDDPQYGYDAGYWAEQVRLRCQRGDDIANVVDYIICDGRSCSIRTGWQWVPYGGTNPHVSHAHYSIHYTTYAEQWTGQWWTPANPTGGFGTMTDQEILDEFANVTKRTGAQLDAAVDKLHDQAKRHNEAARERDVKLLTVLTEIRDAVEKLAVK